MFYKVYIHCIGLCFFLASCQQDEEIKRSLKFFNPNAEQVLLLDGEEKFIANLPELDTTIVSIDVVSNDKYIVQYANCQKEIIDQFFIKDVVVLAPNFVVCDNSDLVDADIFSINDLAIYQLIINALTEGSTAFILAQNTSEIIKIGDIDIDSKTTLEKNGNFLFDSLALAQYKSNNQPTNHIYLPSINELELISKKALNCFISQSISCDYVDHINCTFGKSFIQLSRIGISENQAIITYRNQCCRGFAVFEIIDGSYHLVYNQDLC